MLSYSFLIEIGNKKLLYSGDLGSLDDIESNLKDLDLLVVETMHIDISGLAERLDKYSIKKAVLTHTGAEQRAQVDSFAKSYRGKCRIIIAEDNQTVEI
jgi:ribonuclease BN (tRNA processing enzyme)